MQFTLTIEDPRPEAIARQLRLAANDIESGHGDGWTYDSAGERNGKWEVRETPRGDRAGSASHLDSWGHLA
jgi:hypothetical protein